VDLGTCVCELINIEEAGLQRVDMSDADSTFGTVINLDDKFFITQYANNAGVFMFNFDEILNHPDGCVDLVESIEN
jgi:hypothetical protein